MMTLNMIKLTDNCLYLTHTAFLLIFNTRESDLFDYGLGCYNECNSALSLFAMQPFNKLFLYFDFLNHCPWLTRPLI